MGRSRREKGRPYPPARKLIHGGVSCSATIAVRLIFRPNSRTHSPASGPPTSKRVRTLRNNYIRQYVLDHLILRSSQGIRSRVSKGESRVSLSQLPIQLSLILIIIPLRLALRVLERIGVKDGPLNKRTYQRRNLKNMDPEADDHLSPQQQVNITKKSKARTCTLPPFQFLIVYYGGFFLLPWLWFINFLFWFEYIKGRRDASAESRTCTINDERAYTLSYLVFSRCFEIPCFLSLERCDLLPLVYNISGGMAVVGIGYALILAFCFLLLIPFFSRCGSPRCKHTQRTPDIIAVSPVRLCDLFPCFVN